MTKEEVKSTPIGTKVEIRQILRRVQKPGNRRVWEPVNFIEPNAARAAFFVGYTYLCNGWAKWYGDHCEWTPDNSPRMFVARVKFSPTGCDYYVLPVDVARQVPEVVMTKLVLSKSDILVVKLKEETSATAKDHVLTLMKQVLKESGYSNKVLVADASLDFGVIRKKAE